MKKRSLAKLAISSILVVMLLSACGAVGGGAGGNKIIKPNNFVRNQSELVLRPDDLSFDYKLVSGSEARFSNEQVQYDRGQNQGKAYIVATGRVDGYMLALERSKSTDIAPHTYTSTVEVFETTEGASLAYSDEYLMLDVDPKWEEDENGDCKIGSECKFVSYSEFQPTTNLVNERHDVIFRYQNTLIVVTTRSLDIEVSLQDALDAAQAIYDKLAVLETVTP